MKRPTSLRGDIHVSHDWLTIERLSFGPSDPLTTLGSDTPPWSDDPLFEHDADTNMERFLRRYAVASDLPTRRPFVPAWVYAFVEATWTTLSEVGIVNALDWAVTMPDPPRYAQALLVVWGEKRERTAMLRDDSAVKRLRLLREAMRDLGDPQGLPDEAR